MLSDCTWNPAADCCPLLVVAGPAASPYWLWLVLLLPLLPLLPLLVFCNPLLVLYSLLLILYCPYWLLLLAFYFLNQMLRGKNEDR